MSIFRCPLCKGSLRPIADKSLQCSNRHCFDWAKQGYVNLLTTPHKSAYDSRLFLARAAVCRSGLYRPLYQLISKLLAAHPHAEERNELAILDAGCGEGSHLAAIVNMLKEQTQATIDGTGVDIVKEGILQAAKQYPWLRWGVADLANSPFADSRFSTILNILSPASYREFERMLAPDGLLIKVIPEDGYLHELRSVALGHTNRATYTNEPVVNRFCSRFALVEKQRLRYSTVLDHSLIGPLIRMTPLLWKAEDAVLQPILSSPRLAITIDVTVLVGIADRS